MDILHYLRIHAKHGVITLEEVKRPLRVEHYNEAYSRGLKTTKDLVNHWDSVGQTYGNYRYFLLSKSVPLI